MSGFKERMKEFFAPETRAGELILFGGGLLVASAAAAGGVVLIEDTGSTIGLTLGPTAEVLAGYSLVVSIDAWSRIHNPPAAGSSKPDHSSEA